MNEMMRAVIEDPATSHWLRQAVLGLENRDPLDALADAEKLAEIAHVRWWDLIKDKGAA